MAANKGVVLASNIATTTDTASVTWPGGYAVLVLTATTYPTVCNLQIQNIDGVWVSLAPSTVTSFGAAATMSTNSAFGFNCPAGQYRMHLSGATTSALYAALVAVTFD